MLSTTFISDDHWCCSHLYKMSSALFPLLLLALVAPPCLLTGRDEGLLLDEPPELKLKFDMRLRFNMFLSIFQPVSMLQTMNC